MTYCSTRPVVKTSHRPVAISTDIGSAREWHRDSKKRQRPALTHTPHDLNTAEDVDGHLESPPVDDRLDDDGTSHLSGELLPAPSGPVLNV